MEGGEPRPIRFARLCGIDIFKRFVKFTDTGSKPVRIYPGKSKNRIRPRDDRIAREAQNTHRSENRYLPRRRNNFAPMDLIGTPLQRNRRHEVGSKFAFQKIPFSAPGAVDSGGGSAKHDGERDERSPVPHSPKKTRPHIPTLMMCRSNGNQRILPANRRFRPATVVHNRACSAGTHRVPWKYHAWHATANSG